MQDLEVLDTAREDLLFASTTSPPHPTRRGHPLLAGPQHARPHLRRDAAGVEGRLRRRHLHRVHGAARARPHRARRHHLPQRPARPHSRSRRRAWPAWTSSHDPRRLRQAAGTQRYDRWRRAPSSGSPNATPNPPRAWPPPKPTRAARPNWSASPRSAGTSPRIAPRNFHEASNPTGSSTWAWSPN